MGRGLAGDIRMGIVPTAAQFLLPQAVRRLLGEAPDVTLKTTVALIDMLKPMLSAGELDLVVGTESPDPGRLRVHRLAEDPSWSRPRVKHEIFSLARPP